MCLTAPGRVLEVEPGIALVDLDGHVRRASTLLAPSTRPGDWVIVAGGAVLSVIDRDRAIAMGRAYRIANQDIGTQAARRIP